MVKGDTEKTYWRLLIFEMTKHNTIKRSLIASVLVLCLCFTSFIGTTFAWFTDSATSGGNVITAGTLKIDVQYTLDGATWTDLSGAEDLFQKGLWEPGHTEIVAIKVANVGDLALKYVTNLNVLSETIGKTAGGDDIVLSEILTVSTLVAANADEVAAAFANEGVEYDATALLKDAGTLRGETAMYEDDVHYLVIKVDMADTVGNEANSNGVNVPSIDLGIKVLAAQLAYENDSFGDQYDNDATYPVLSNSVPVTGNAQTSAMLTTTNMQIEVPAELLNSLADVAEKMDVRHSEPRVENDTVIFDSVELYDENGNVIDLEALDNDTPVAVTLYVGDAFAEGTLVKVLHDAELVAEATVDANGNISYTATHFCKVELVESPLVTINRGAVVYKFATIQAAMDSAEDGDVLAMRESTNTTDDPLTETITVTKKVSLVPNGMYLVSSAPATFTVAEGGKLTIETGSYTVKNISSNGAAVIVDGGEFVMAGGSFDAHTAVRTVAEKSSTVTLAAGWSNKVTVGFDLNGDDTLNVTGGSLYTSQEVIKAAAGTSVNVNISNGTLSSGGLGTYSAAADLKGVANFNMTGGTLQSTANEDIALCVYNDSTVNVSGNAFISGGNCGIALGGAGFRESGGNNNVVNISGNATVKATGKGNRFNIGFAVAVYTTNTAVNLSGDATVTAPAYGVYAAKEGCSVTVSERAVVNVPGIQYSGYGVAALSVTITGGTITAKEYAVLTISGGTVTIDNSVSGDAIYIKANTSSLSIPNDATLVVKGNPDIVGYSAN